MPGGGTDAISTAPCPLAREDATTANHSGLQLTLNLSVSLQGQIKKKDMKMSRQLPRRAVSQANTTVRKEDTKTSAVKHHKPKVGSFPLSHDSVHSFSQKQYCIKKVKVDSYIAHYPTLSKHFTVYSLTELFS